MTSSIPLDTLVSVCSLASMNAVSEHTVQASSTGLVTGFQHRLARQFQVQAADWLDTCRALADWEDRFLVEVSSAGRLAEHAAMLDDLERVGQWLASAANHVDSDFGPTTQQIQLALQDLCDSRAMWHGKVSAQRQQEILRECLHES